MTITPEALAKLQNYFDVKLSEAQLIIESKDSIDQLRGLIGFKNELSKSIDADKAAAAEAKKELDKVKGSIKAAEAKAADIVAKAEAQATGAIEAARDSITVNQQKADKKLADTNKATSDAETRRVVAEGMAKDAEAKLAAINTELEAARARMQKVLG